jgi:hypothetical protein
VADYTDGQDKIAFLNNTTINSFSALQPFMTQSGSDVLINMTGSPTIRLQNVSLSSLDASDFWFGPRLSTFIGTTAAETLTGTDNFDTNGDGKLSAADADWGRFSVWVDRNGDGIQSKKELLSMAKAGVASIDLRANAVNRDWD